MKLSKYSIKIEREALSFTNKNKVKDPDTGEVHDLNNKAKCIKYVYQNLFVRN